MGDEELDAGVPAGDAGTDTGDGGTVAGSAAGVVPPVEPRPPDPPPVVTTTTTTTSTPVQPKPVPFVVPRNDPPAGEVATSTAGRGSAPSGTSGFSFSTLGDALWMAANAGVEWKKHKIGVTHGPLITIVNGNKHSHTVGFDEFAHIGASFQEVVGFDSKIAMGGDVREISGKRWERNIGLKVESVVGKVFEHKKSKEFVDTEQVQKEASASLKEQAARERERICKEVREKVQKRLMEVRGAVAVKLKEAECMFKEWTRDHKSYTATIEKCAAKFHEYAGRISTAKYQAKQFKLKTEKFCKMIAKASITLKASRIKGSAKKKVVFVAKALAEFKGKIKAGG